MDGEKQNIVLYDWLSFTSKKHTPEELISAMGLSSCPWQEIKGAHGYRDRKYFSSISVHYNGGGYGRMGGDVRTGLPCL